jgi:hypothetical protein
MTRVLGVLLVVVVAAAGCPPMQSVPTDGNDPSVAYLRDEVDEMHEKLAKQTDANTRFAGEVKRLQDSVGTESGRLTRVDQRVTSMLIDVGEVRARMELLEGSRKLSDRTIAFLQTPIEFNYNTDELQKAGRRRIEVVADFLDVNRDVQVVVVGFLPPGCPTIDAPECGEDPLVQRRVKVVLGRLQKGSVAGDRVGEEFVELPRGMQRDDVYMSLRTEGETPPPPTPRPEVAAPPQGGTPPAPGPSAPPAGAPAPAGAAPSATAPAASAPPPSDAPAAKPPATTAMPASKPTTPATTPPKTERPSSPPTTAPKTTD